MRPTVVTKSLSTAASANGIATSQSLASAGALTLNGSFVSGGVATLAPSQRRVIITSAGNDAGLTWTIIGTDDSGSQIKDSFPGANGIAQSNLNFATVTSITGSGATASTVTAGTNGIGSSPWVMFDTYIPTPNLDIVVKLTGTINATIETTQDPFLVPIPDPRAPTSSIANGPANPNPSAQAFGPLAALTSGNTEGQINYPIHAWRVTINSGTGSVTATGRQAGVSSP